MLKTYKPWKYDCGAQRSRLKIKLWKRFVLKDFSELVLTYGCPCKKCKDFMKNFQKNFDPIFGQVAVGQTTTRRGMVQGKYAICAFSPVQGEKLEGTVFFTCVESRGKFRASCVRFFSPNLLIHSCSECGIVLSPTSQKKLRVKNPIFQFLFFFSFFLSGGVNKFQHQIITRHLLLLNIG